VSESVFSEDELVSHVELSPDVALADVHPPSEVELDIAPPLEPVAGVP